MIDIDKKTFDSLIDTARAAREKSYCPYSDFAVGAALLCSDGDIFTGANIESSSYTPTICAERVAFSSAVHAGKNEFKAIAVVGGKAAESVSAYTPPCRVCRQFMTEFCSADFPVILFDGKEPKVLTLGELLPESFTKTNLF